MRNKKKNEKGSVTVFITLILIPTLFLSGFLTDLARIKLYSNQALMAADNYGEAVLTQYDDLLKELYGLFAVTQDSEGMKAIEELQEYMEISFNPSKKVVGFSHLQGTFVNPGTSYKGFMPYQDAKLEFGYETASEQATLGNLDVLSTQIGDFMRYRIVQSLWNGSAGTEDEEISDATGDWMLDAVDVAQGSKADTDVQKAKQDLDEQLEKSLDAMKKYYEQLKKVDGYKEIYLKGLNKNYQISKQELKELERSDRYQTYIEAAKAADAEAKAPAEDDTGEEDQEEEEEEEDKPETIDLDQEGKYFEKEIDRIIEKYQNCYNHGDPHDEYKVTFSNYADESSKLMSHAVTVRDEIEKIQDLQRILEEKLQQEGVSEQLRKNMKEEINSLYSLFDHSNPSMSGDTYVEIAELFQSNANIQKNEEFGNAATKISYSLDDIKSYDLRYYNGIQDQYEDDETIIPAEEIKISSFQDFKSNAVYAKLYQSLTKSFGSESDSEEEKKAKKKKKEGEDKVKEKEKKLQEEEESCSARDIPAAIPIGDNKHAGGIKFGDTIASAMSLFNGNLIDAKNELLLKVYTVNYDLGMFSSQVTNAAEATDAKKSLTGYEMGQNINYLYQAELEYLYGGHKSSKENLKETRNTILLFRTAVNLTSTYTIKEINSAIKAVTSACSAFNPILGVAVAAALRLGVASIETYADWELLKKGESVTLVKTKVTELSAFEEISSLIPIQRDGRADSTGKTKKAMKLNYEQYLTILLILFTPRDNVASRTGDLVCLNVNHVKQGGELSSLDFQMDQAITAIRASCSIHLDFVVVPDGFARMTMDDSIYGEMQEFQKNYYQYSVVRGY